MHDSWHRCTDVRREQNICEACHRALRTLPAHPIHYPQPTAHKWGSCNEIRRTEAWEGSAINRRLQMPIRILWYRHPLYALMKTSGYTVKSCAAGTKILWSGLKVQRSELTTHCTTCTAQSALHKGCKPPFWNTSLQALQSNGTQRPVRDLVVYTDATLLSLRLTKKLTMLRECRKMIAS